MTDPVGNTTGFFYDRLDRLVAETNQLGHGRSYEYDAAGNLIEATDRDGRVVEFQYDALGRLEEERWLDGSLQVVATIALGYDDAGRIVRVADPGARYEYVYNEVGDVVSVRMAPSDLAQQGPETVSDALVEFRYGYDAAGNLKTAAESSDVVAGLDGATRYDYDPLGRLEVVRQEVDGTVNKRADFAYHADGQFDTITRYADDGLNPVATTDYATYDGIGRLAEFSHAYGLTTLDYSYLYDAAGRIWQITIPDGTVGYFHDATGQLTAVNYDGDWIQDESFGYDAGGNRESADGLTYATGDANRLASDGTFAYLHDNEGNRTARFVDANANGLLDAGDTDITEYQWDHRNRLVRVTDRAAYGGAATQVVEYTYDYLDRRIRKTVDADGDGTVDEYAYQAHRGDHLALEFTDPDGLADDTHDPAVAHRYLYGAAVDQILAVEDSGGSVLWGLDDHQGTIRDVIDSTGALVRHVEYTAFGRHANGTAPIADFLFGFTGRPFDDATGLYDYRARWYDPEVGRFASEDPLGFAAGDVNLYRYAGNSPVMHVDPSGLCFTGLANAAKSVGNVMGGAISSVGSYFGSSSPTLSTLAGSIGQAFGSGVSYVGSSIGQAFSSVGVSAGYLGQAVSTVGGWANSITSPATTWASSVGTAVASLPGLGSTLSLGSSDTVKIRPLVMPEVFAAHTPDHSIAMAVTEPSPTEISPPDPREGPARPVPHPTEGMGFWEKFGYYLTETAEQLGQRLAAERDQRLLEGGAIENGYDLARYRQLRLPLAEYEIWQQRSLGSGSTAPLGRVDAIHRSYGSPHEAEVQFHSDSISQYGFAHAVFSSGGLGEHALILFSGAAKGVPGLPRSQPGQPRTYAYEKGAPANPRTITPYRDPARPSYNNAATHIDHAQARALGGSNAPSNLRRLAAETNLRKGGFEGQLKAYEQYLIRNGMTPKDARSVIQAEIDGLRVSPPPRPMDPRILDHLPANPLDQSYPH